MFGDHWCWVVSVYVVELADQGFAATVGVIEPTGAETLVFLRFGNHELVALFRERHDLTPGQTIHLRPRMGQGHIFDTATGKRL